MPIEGLSNFAKGETTISRVGFGSEVVLERCNGYRCDDGSLTPDDLVDKLTSSALGATVPEQVPAAFVANEATKIICRDKSEQMRECSANAWGSAGSVCDVLAESTPARVGKQIVFPAGDSFADLMAYEPGSASTRLRPLSLKAPTDYIASAKPVVTASSLTATRLFDCDDAESDWAGLSANYVAATSGDKATLTLNSSTTAGQKAFTKDLGSTGIGLTNKEYLVIDLRLQNDQQLYSEAGLFPNNSGLMASGYILSLYTDQACTALIASYYLPRLDTSGKVNRVAIKISSTSTCKGISIDTSSFYVPPASGDPSYILTVYSEVYTSAWTHKGNFLLPEIVYSKSPLAEAFETVQDNTATTIPVGTNLLLNPGFEDGAAGLDNWTGVGVDPNVNSRYPRSGTNSLVIDDATDGARQDNVAVTAGKQYYFEGWSQKQTSTKMSWRATIQPKTAGDVNVGSAIYIPSSGAFESQFNKWTRLKGSVTIPATATKVSITAASVDGANNEYHVVDDLAFYAVDSTVATTTVVLQTFSEDMTSRAPETPLVRYRACFAGKDLLGGGDYKLMISDPSEVSSPDVVADPWKSYSVALTLPVGQVATIAADPTAGGTDYDVGDILTITTGGTEAKVKVTAVDDDPTNGVVTGLKLISRGSGYTTGTGKVTAALTGEGSGCTVNISAITNQRAIDEYGYYLTDVIIYRSIYDGATKTWGAWSYVGSANIGTTSTVVDTGNDAVASLHGLDVPEEMETHNAAASSARYVAYKDNRVVSLCLGWDEATGAWLKPTALQVSSYEKPWAHPSIPDLATDGWVVDGYQVTGAVGRGLAVLDEDLLVFLDSEFFHLRGNDATTGYQFIGRQAIGCASNRSIAVGRRFVIFHDGTNFVQYAGGVERPISRFLVDSSLIDWEETHSAVICKDQYVFHCEHDGDWALLIYDTRSDSWRIRRSDALEVVGICTDGLSVYGVTPAGDLVDVFGGTADDGAASVVREVFTQYVRIAPAGEEAQVSELVFDIESASAVDLALSVSVLGAKNATVTDTLTTVTTKTRHTLGVNLKGEFIKVEMTYTGTAPPTIRFIGFGIDGRMRRP